MRLRNTLRVSAAALLGLLLCGFEPAAAAKRSDQAGAQRAHATTSRAGGSHARPAASRQAGHQAGRSQQGQRQARTGHVQRVERAAPLRGRLAVSRDSRAAYATSGCTRDRHGKCRGAQAQRTSMSWTQGLPPAANVQAHECPGGTMATLARGHDDIVRCMPL